MRVFQYNVQLLLLYIKIEQKTNSILIIKCLENVSV